MSKETKEQKAMREHYEKLVKDAIAEGPADFDSLTQQHKDFLAWKYCQLYHVENAMGGFANFRYWITEHGENFFRTAEKQQQRIQELEQLAKKHEEIIQYCYDACLCERFSTKGFDYGQNHPVFGKPEKGSRPYTPKDLIENWMGFEWVYAHPTKPGNSAKRLNFKFYQNKKLNNFKSSSEWSKV